MTVTATDDSGIKEDYNVPSLWHGPGQKMPDDPDGFVVPDNGTGDCVAHSATTTTCTFTLTMNPRIDTQDNTTAGIWKVVTCPAGAGSRPRHVNRAVRPGGHPRARGDGLGIAVSQQRSAAAPRTRAADPYGHGFTPVKADADRCCCSSARGVGGASVAEEVHGVVNILQVRRSAAQLQSNGRRQVVPEKWLLYLLDECQ